MSFEIKQNKLSDAIKKKIFHGFAQQAIKITGIDGLSEEAISFEIFDKSGFVGAIVVQLFWGQLHIKFLLVEEKYRGQGIGRQLMAHALEFGNTRECHFAFVETMSFQALEFYQKMGFKQDFVRTGYAQGTSLYYLSRKLINQ